MKKYSQDFKILNLCYIASASGVTVVIFLDLPVVRFWIQRLNFGILTSQQLDVWIQRLDIRIRRQQSAVRF